MFTFQSLKWDQTVTSAGGRAIELTVFFECADKSCRISALRDETFPPRPALFVVLAFNASNKRTRFDRYRLTAHINGVSPSRLVALMSLPQATNASQTTAASATRVTGTVKNEPLCTKMSRIHRYDTSFFVPVSGDTVYVCAFPNEIINTLQWSIIHSFEQWRPPARHYIGTHIRVFSFPHLPGRITRVNVRSVI